MFPTLNINGYAYGLKFFRLMIVSHPHRYLKDFNLIFDRLKKSNFSSIFLAENNFRWMVEKFQKKRIFEIHQILKRDISGS
jgi:hypothetical protein